MGEGEIKVTLAFLFQEINFVGFTGAISDFYAQETFKHSKVCLRWNLSSIHFHSYDPFFYINLQYASIYRSLSTDFKL